nr:uncharacterized protein LOC115265674 [Aedes albopictus]
MDEYVKDILGNCVPELIPTFEEEEVNEKAFKCLTDDIIRELVPKLGKRAIFNKAYRAYREALDALDKKPDFSVVVKPHEPVSLPDPVCSPVVVIKSETAIGDVPDNDTSMVESQVSLEDTFKLEPQVPEEAVAEEVQVSEHQELEAASASSVDNECVDTSKTAHGSLGTSGVDQSLMETESNDELFGSVSNTSVINQNLPETFQDKTATDNAVTETTAELSINANILIEAEELDHEGLDNVLATAVDVDNVQTVGETFDIIETSMSNVQHESNDSPITEMTESQFTEERAYHGSDNQLVDSAIDEALIAQDQEDCGSSTQAEYPLRNQCIDGSPTSHITFSISELSDPAEEDLKSAESLRQLLSTSTTVNHLLGKPFLTRSTRNALTEEIVDHLCTSADGVLSNELLRSWARAVELVFAQEVNQLYFRESEDGYSCGGKLVQCYQRRKQGDADTANRETG